MPQKAQEYYVRQAQNYYHRIRNKRKNELAAEYMEEVKKYMHGVGGDIIKLERELFLKKKVLHRACFASNGIGHFLPMNKLQKGDKN